MATALISAGEAMHYLAYVWDSVFVSFALPVIPAALLLIGAFTLLTILGISESSCVAITIFVTHMATLTLLALLAIGAIFIWGEKGVTTFRQNWSSELMVVDTDAAPPYAAGVTPHVGGH